MGSRDRIEWSIYLSSRLNTYLYSETSFKAIKKFKFCSEHFKIWGRKAFKSSIICLKLIIQWLKIFVNIGTPVQNSDGGGAKKIDFNINNILIYWRV